ncbi:MAG: nitroreductase family protein [Pseudomonadota bacterium]|nr:nitroreductase family protein [Pseudomonadota bacterium]
MWDFFETVRHRHSVRKYRSDLPVERDKLHAILEVACSAPSAGDLQSYRIVVVTDAGTQQALVQAAGNQAFIAEAPVNLVFCADAQRAAEQYGTRGADLFSTQDATIAASYTQLAAVAAGLATAWVGSFNEEKIRNALELADSLRPVALICLGYPAETPQLTHRRPISEMVTYYGKS